MAPSTDPAIPSRVTPPADSPVSRTCRRSQWTAGLSGSLKIIRMVPLPVVYETDSRVGGLVFSTSTSRTAVTVLPIESVHA